MSDPNKITYFGLTDFRNERKRFGIKNKDRAQHMYVIGKTGMGKSTLLENMAAQDIENGEGMCFIDAHGSAIEILIDYIPEHRIKDVVYFAPFDSDHPIAFNVMEDVDPDKRHLVASGLMSTFKKIWVDAWSARMEYILNNTILALLEYPNSTLLSVNRMLSDKGFRQEVVRNISDPSVKAFWVDEFGKWEERYAREASAAIQNKIGQFTTNPLIRNIIGQPHSSFDVRDMMDNQKIFLVNLSKGQIGEQNAGLLGGMIITAIYLGAMSRAELSKDQMAKTPDFYLFVDEFQNFANESFADILAEARKYKLSLTVAHQYIAQMEESVADAIFGNVGTTISYRVGPMDAETLEKIFAPTFMQEDIVNLGRFQMYLTLMIDGVGSQTFSATGISPLEKPAISYRTQVIDSSREQFTEHRAGVQKTIEDWHAQEFETNRQVKQTEKIVKKFGSDFRKNREEQTEQPMVPIPEPSKIIVPEEIKQTILQQKEEKILKEDVKIPVSKIIIPEKIIIPNPPQIQTTSFQQKKSTFKPKTIDRVNPKGNLKKFLDTVETPKKPMGIPIPNFSKKEASVENKNTLKEALMMALNQNAPKEKTIENVLEKKEFKQVKEFNNKPEKTNRKDITLSSLVAQAEQVLEKYNTSHGNPATEDFGTKTHITNHSTGVKEIPEDVLRSILD